MTLTPSEANALLAYIAELKGAHKLDIWRKHGLGMGEQSANQVAALVQQHPSVTTALKKLQEATNGEE